MILVVGSSHSVSSFCMNHFWNDRGMSTIPGGTIGRTSARILRVRSTRILFFLLFLASAKNWTPSRCHNRLWICCQPDNRGFAGISADAKLGDYRSHHKYIWDGARSDSVRLEYETLLVGPRRCFGWCSKGEKKIFSWFRSCESEDGIPAQSALSLKAKSLKDWSAALPARARLL
jgi:hypothetical protein